MGSRRRAGGDCGPNRAHHFEWASLLVDFTARSKQNDLIPYALYASAVANRLNRATGRQPTELFSRDGLRFDLISRSWPQTEAIKASHRARPRRWA